MTPARLFALLVCVLGMSGRTMLAADDSDSFAAKIRPLMQARCMSCHSTKASKGGLDLERFANVALIREDIEVWQSVLERIESGEMPPMGKKQLEPAQRQKVVTWIRGVIDHEARRRAGDPGPVLVRRLNNAEYNYVIRDLTGVGLQPSRQFPADGAAGEGFLNATDALTISPDQMRKYLDAAKDVAAHAVLLPDGIRFSTSTSSADWRNEVLDEIVGLYSKHTNEFGQIPLSRYLAATVKHRDAFYAGGTSIAAVAAGENLSPKYLQVLWDAMRNDQPSVFVREVVAAWQECTPDSVANLATDVSALQALLWHKRNPLGMHTLDDRYVPPQISLVNSQTYRLDMPPPDKDGTITFYMSARAFGDAGQNVNLILENARFEAPEKPPLALREVMENTGPTTAKEPLLKQSHFGAHPDNKPIDEGSLVLRDSETLAVQLKGSLVAGRAFVVDVQVESGSSLDVVVYFDARLTRAPPSVKQGVAWTDKAGPSERRFLTTGADAAARQRFETAANEFRQLFPARVCYPGVWVRDTVVTLERFHRGDGFLSGLLLSEQEHVRLDRLWEELHFISQDALHVQASYATLTQGEFTEYEGVSEVIHRRAKETEEALLKSEPLHLDALLDFAARACRRPLTKAEQQSFRDLYQSLRQAKLPHDESFRAVLARVLVSPHFLYRLETPPPGKQAAPVSDRELATRLSFFLWSSIPDDELRQVAEEGRLQDPEVLEQQVRRMLRDERCRELAVEFGTQWLEVRNFSDFAGKNEELFPAFNAELRRAMYEESILLFHNMFRADLPMAQLIDAGHTFVNQTLADHYGLPGVEGNEFRRIAAAHEHGRGGILALGSVLSKHSGASRTSPVLRGNWIAENLLGERLPRPPDNVPVLPEAETSDGLSVRELVERHTQLPQCASCHQRIDPLGFALEQYDTIGRRRDKDAAGRPADARARLKDGTDFEGLDGLRQYLLTDRKDDFERQFCRKLLGYALGRRVILSDRPLLEEMAAELEQNEGRVSAAILAIVRSKQFRFIRGADFGQ